MKTIIENTVNQSNSVIEEIQNVDKAVKNIRSYITDPVFTVKKITSDPNAEGTEEFKEIEQGLFGEYTKQQATELGLHKLVSIYNTAVNKLKDTNVSYEEFRDSINNELKELLKITCNNVDTKILDRRKERYMTNTFTRQYMLKKLNNEIDVKSASINSLRSADKYLFVIREILASIRLGDFTEFSKVQAKYQHEIEVIKCNLEDLTSEGLEPFTVVNSIKIEEENSDDKFKRLIEETDTPTEDVDMLAVLNSIIDDIGRTVDEISKNIDKLSSISVTNRIICINDIVDAISSSAVLPYTENKIMASDFTRIYGHGVTILNSYVALNTEYKYAYLNAAKTIFDNIKIFNYIYSLLDEVTLKGQLMKEPK